MTALNGPLFASGVDGLLMKSVRAQSDTRPHLAAALTTSLVCTGILRTVYPARHRISDTWKMAGAQSKSMSTLEDVWARRATQDLPNLKPHPVTGRLIDNYPGQRTRPMKVLVLGMSRTGTMSLLTALESADFNYRVYHMVKAMQAPRANFYTWIEGLRAKYHGVGKPWGREEFDKILGNCM